jgi:molybdenum cofactor guanylyltransferase
MSFSAVLLAGGESRRMGQDKATLLFHDCPLWQVQLGLLRKVAPPEIYISAQIDPSWRPADVVFVADAQPARGPLSGIAAVLSRVASDHLLVLAIDMPFMTDVYLRRLCKQIGPDRGVVPMIQDCAEPLAAIYPRSASGDFVTVLSGDDFSLQSLVYQLIGADKLLPIPVSEQEKPLFRNLNKPGDVEL